MHQGNINVITPPDRLFNLNLSYLLIKPSAKVQMQFQQILSLVDETINVYVYEGSQDIEWLLSVAQQVDIIIVDIDNCDPQTRNFISFLLVSPHAFYLTNDDITPWGLISRNRIHNLDWLVERMVQSEDEDDDDDE